MHSQHCGVPSAQTQKSQTRCRFCRRLIDQAWYAKKADARRQTEALVVLDQLQSRRSMAFLDESIDRFGGPDRLADDLHKVFQSIGASSSKSCDRWSM
jgi:hypothetical protein